MGEGVDWSVGSEELPGLPLPRSMTVGKGVAVGSTWVKVIRGFWEEVNIPFGSLMGTESPELVR